MSALSLSKRALAAVWVAVAVATAGATALAAPATAAVCTDIHVVFARGTADLQPLGIVGGPFVDAVRANSLGRSVSAYGVNYAAAIDQSSAGPGATDMTNHVVQYAQQCPGAKIILGGYSQGASVTDIAIGIPTLLGAGRTIPTSLAPRISAVVVFGNPLRLFGSWLNTASLLYGSKSFDDCNSGDPVCLGGVNVLAHLAYSWDGSAAEGGRFAAARTLL
jgi:cutinase